LVCLVVYFPLAFPPVLIPLLPIHATTHNSFFSTWLFYLYLAKRIITKFLVMQFSPTSHHFAPLPSQYPLFSNTLTVCFSLNIRDQVSPPYRTTGKITILCILVFTFLDSRREDERLCSEC
jgi:hypothetical protein